MVDNLELIRKELVFRPGIYYFAQVIVRKKDVPDLKKSEIIISQRFIDSSNVWDSLVPKFKKECKENTGRLYISLIPRSIERLSTLMMYKFSESILMKSNVTPWRCLNSSALNSKTSMAREIYGKSRWILDIDTSERDIQLEIIDIVSKFTTIHLEIPTSGGIHLWIDSMSLPTLNKELKYYKENEIITVINSCNTLGLKSL